EAAFLRSDFSFSVVQSHSSTTTPTYYKAAAAWSSQEGSLLLWAWLLALWSSLVLFLTRKRMRDVTPVATGVLLVFAAFFCSLLVFSASPFDTLPAAAVPQEGVGLNPLLRHPSMMIHPPMLYSGYTLATIPFAFAIGALITGRLDAEWTRATRRFSLLAWLCLGIGILLGARWSWTELGWGGYWAWDPVENAALMPWLTGTALLHSVMVQERRGMLKTWTVSLVLATGLLAVLGTFLVRSGILQSIHAFGASTLGVPFLAFIAALAIGSVGLVSFRREELRSARRDYSLLSRESIFLLNNLVLVGLCFVIFWGTFFPLISEILSGHKDAVGPEWFNRYTMPLAIVLVFLSGLGPAVAWRRTTPRNARRTFRVPLMAGGVVTAILFAYPGTSGSPASVIMFAAVAFAVSAVLQETWRAAAVRRTTSGEPAVLALRGVVARNRRRYGGYLVHIGMAVLFIGIAASSAFQHISEVQLTPGHAATVAGYRLRYVHPTASVSPQKVALGAVVDVSRGGHHVTTLSPAMGYYPIINAGLGPIASYFDGNAESAVGLKAGVRRDIWTSVDPDLDSFQSAISGIDQRFPRAGGSSQLVLLSVIAARYVKAPPPATFRFIVSPLVEWIWLGGLIAGLGGLLALSPTGLARRAGSSARTRRPASVGAGRRDRVTVST
ncbi:MAG TPA: cytochrome c-type biogenesis CcmF C-terminal domain-containing protein, partial [Solirubrobacteraceae bacterium]|nr:cytochrome c-type biogenesis CcmF C-terminal domain-containing protein [Solirubrobacteraceae bacterium]